MGKGKKGREIEPLMDEEAFVRHVYQAAELTSISEDAEQFARHLWPSVRRLAASAWLEGRAAGKKSENPYSKP